MSARRLKFETPSTLQQLNFLRNLYYERTDRQEVSPEAIEAVRELLAS